MTNDEKSAINAAITALMEDTANVHVGTRHLLRFFRFGHLPEVLQQVSARFAACAVFVAVHTDGPEATVALRKLLEAKDAAVRAAL